MPDCRNESEGEEEEEKEKKKRKRRKGWQRMGRINESTPDSAFDFSFHLIA